MVGKSAAGAATSGRSPRILYRTSSAAAETRCAFLRDFFVVILQGSDESESESETTEFTFTQSIADATTDGEAVCELSD